MVDEYRNIMAFMDIFAHLHILRRKRRGIQPEVIQRDYPCSNGCLQYYVWKAKTLASVGGNKTAF
jgi:hypothetical protein